MMRFAHEHVANRIIDMPLQRFRLKKCPAHGLPMMRKVHAHQYLSLRGQRPRLNGNPAPEASGKKKHGARDHITLTTNYSNKLARRNARSD